MHELSPALNDPIHLARLIQVVKSLMQYRNFSIKRLSTCNNQMLARILKQIGLVLLFLDCSLNIYSFFSFFGHVQLLQTVSSFISPLQLLHVNRDVKISCNV